MSEQQRPVGLADPPRIKMQADAVIEVGSAVFIRKGEEVYQGSQKIQTHYLTEEEFKAVFPERIKDGTRPCPIDGCGFEIAVADKRSAVTHVRSAHPETWESLKDEFADLKTAQECCAVIEREATKKT